MPIGAHFFSTDAVRFRTAAIGGPAIAQERRRRRFSDLGRYMLSATPGGREELRRLVDPGFADLVDELQPQDLPVVSYRPAGMTFAGTNVRTSTVEIRIDNSDGDPVGVCIQIQPAVGMSQLAAAAAMADLAHLERMRSSNIPTVAKRRF